MARVKLDIAYVGTGFAGWQVQSLAQGRPQRTVQGELEKALAAVLGKPARLHVSGRTDAGVHADCQSAHFDAPEKYRNINWPAALQRHLPKEITVLSAAAAKPDFHARFSAKGKVYAYALWLAPTPLPPKLRPFAWASGPLDIELMDQAAARLTGEHDFAAFQNSGSKVEDTTRDIYEIRRLYLPLPGEASTGGSPLLAWEFTGNGFLKQMVRNLVGFMVACGQKKMAPAEAEAIFASKRRAAGQFATAPAHGLTLRRVIY
jgi:tRNA pseudouridine38-40 synthase